MCVSLSVCLYAYVCVYGSVHSLGLLFITMNWPVTRQCTGKHVQREGTIACLSICVPVSVCVAVCIALAYHLLQ